MKKFRNILALALFAVAALSITPAAFAGDFAIVVNAGNSAEADISEIKNMYLKKKTSWGNGLTSIPLGRSTDSPEQDAFLAGILEMGQSDLDSYWASEKSKTGATGPREVGSTSILLRQIGRKEGAFGVVSSADAANLPEGVKVLIDF